MSRDQGIAKAGNAKARTIMIESGVTRGGMGRLISDKPAPGLSDKRAHPPYFTGDQGRGTRILFSMRSSKGTAAARYLGQSLSAASLARRAARSARSS